MNEQQHITKDDIHAYIDGQLSAEKQRLVNERIQTDPELKTTIEQYQQQNELMSALYDPVLDEPVPETLGIQVKSQQLRPVWLSVAVSIMLMLVGGVVGWTINDRQANKHDIVVNLVQPAATAHLVFSPEVKHPVEVGAEQEQHLIKWLSKRLGREIRAPDLSSANFSLIGGRLLPGSEGPAAQFMYEDGSGERLTLYVKSKSSEEQNTAFRFYQQDGADSFYWIDGNLGYVLSGKVTRERLSDAANLVYQQLSF